MKILISATFLCCTLFYQSYGQELDKELETENALLRVDKLLANSKSTKVPDSIIYFGKSALKLSEFLKNDSLIAESASRVAKGYFNKKERETSREFFEKSIEYSTPFQTELKVKHPAPMAYLTGKIRKFANFSTNF